MNYKNKVVLITGGAGSIGSELVRQIYVQKPKKLLVLDHDETRLFELTQDLPRSTPVLMDIRDAAALEYFVAQHEPDVVFHTAAYKHVPMLETYPEEADKTNIGGLIHMIDACDGVAKKFIFISSDKAIDPSCHMGLTKKAGEELCIRADAESKTSFISVRFGNVLASRGSVLTIWKKQLRREQPIEVTDKRMERYLMSVFDACELVLAAADMGKGGELYMLEMGRSVKIIDLAEQFIRLSGKRSSIKMIGARPGEKFNEKLTSDNEKAVKTSHPRILRIIKK